MRVFRGRFSGVGLLLAAAGSVAFLVGVGSLVFIHRHWTAVRIASEQRAVARAEILGQQLAGDLIDRDFTQLQATLKLFASEPELESAAIYDAHNVRVAALSPGFAANPRLSFPLGSDEIRVDVDRIEIWLPLIVDETAHGTLYLAYDQRGLLKLLRADITLGIALTAIAGLIGYAGAFAMRRQFYKPVFLLTETARRVTSERNYSLRVPVASSDELGWLNSAFNSMLDRIESAQRNLRNVTDELDSRVKERTHQLESEVAIRKAFQAELIAAKDSSDSASHAKSNFLANMSHEIRTPLNAVLGFTQLLQTGMDVASENDRREWVEIVHRSGEHLLDLINDILDLSKIEAGQMDFESIPTDPDQIVVDVLNVLKARAAEKGLCLEVLWETERPNAILTDPSRLKQLLLNLVGNAIKFTAAGTVRVALRLNPHDKQLVIRVIDSGIGIAKESQSSVFEPFCQADSSTTRKFGGTGLGLSICRHISRGLGGDVTVESELGHGSTFTVTVSTGSMHDVRLLPPICDINHPVVAPEATNVDQKRYTGTVLVADDGEANQKLIKLVLSRAGLNVICVSNGQEAVDAVAANRFDAVFLDMQMPVMDGYKAAKELVKRGFTKPIVALTAHAMRGDQNKCLTAGCSHYVSKPINPEQLRNVLDSVFDTVSPNQPPRPAEVTSTAPETSHPLMMPCFAETRVSTTTTPEHSPPVFSSPVAPNASPLRTANSTVERAMIRSLLPTNDSEFRAIVVEYLDTLGGRLRDIGSSWRAKDWGQTAAHAHWLKGSGGTAGFPVLSEIGAALEIAAQGREPTAVVKALSDLAATVSLLSGD